MLLLCFPLPYTLPMYLPLIISFHFVCSLVNMSFPISYFFPLSQHWLYSRLTFQHRHYSFSFSSHFAASFHLQHLYVMLPKLTWKERERKKNELVVELNLRNCSTVNAIYTEFWQTPNGLMMPGNGYKHKGVNKLYRLTLVLCIILYHKWTRSCDYTGTHTLGYIGYMILF